MGDHHHYRRSQGDTTGNLPYRRRSQDADQLAITMTQGITDGVPSENHPESREVTGGISDEKSSLNERPSEDHRVRESSHHNGKIPRHQNETKNSQEVEHHSEEGKNEKAQTDEHPHEEGNLTVEKEEEPRRDDSLSHTDEMVALGKNASFYLNSMKKIMENVFR